MADTLAIMKTAKEKKPVKKRNGGIIKKFSDIAKPQKFKGIF